MQRKCNFSFFMYVKYYKKIYYHITEKYNIFIIYYKKSEMLFLYILSQFFFLKKFLLS